MSFVPASPTSLGTFLTCPRQFDAKYISKTVVFQPSTASLYGDRMHKALELRIRDGVELPSEFSFLEAYARQVIESPGTKYVEYSLPMTREWAPCEWRGRHCGGKADLVIVHGTNAAVIDWKSGKQKADMLQLNMLTMGVFAHFPQVTRVNAGLVFFQSGGTEGFNTTRDRFQMPELIRDILRYEVAQEQGHYPPRPNGLCKGWCDVVSCEHNGKGL